LTGAALVVYGIHMSYYNGSFNGNHDWAKANLDMCLTEDEDVAKNYGKVIIEGDLPEDLVFEECEDYDRDTNCAEADSEEFRAARRAAGVDVLVYEDEDERGNSHTCYRMISQAAIDAFFA